MTTKKLLETFDSSDKKLERLKRMIPITSQRFVAGTYVFDGYYGVWLTIKDSFEKFAHEEIGSRENRPKKYLKQCMVTPDYLVFILENYCFPSEEGSEKNNIKKVIEKVRLIESSDPHVLIDLEG